MVKVGKIDLAAADPTRCAGPPFLSESHEGSPSAPANPVPYQDYFSLVRHHGKLPYQDFLLFGGKIVENVKSTDDPSLFQGEIQQVPFR